MLPPQASGPEHVILDHEVPGQVTAYIDTSARRHRLSQTQGAANEKAGHESGLGCVVRDALGVFDSQVLEIVDGVLDADDLFGVFVGNFQRLAVLTELFL